MIIYFTGTGNSRYIAELLAKELNDELIDSTKLIKQGEHPEFNSVKPFVFVAPTYAWRLPRIFKDWMKNCRFGGNKNAYFVLTCGSEMGAAGKYISRFCADIGLDYTGTAEIVMPENYIAMFKAPSAEELLEIIAKAKEPTVKLARLISKGKPFEQVKTTLIDSLASGIVNSCFYTFCISARKFHATDKCIACGKCTKECMLNNITLKDGKPVWGKNCTHCMACICKCPVEAIEYGKRTKNKRRYSFPSENK